MSISNEKTFVPSDNIAWREVNQEIIILNMKSGEYFTLNDVGQKVWLFIINGSCVADIKKNLISEFDVSEEHAESDIESFIQGLIEEGVLHEST